MSTIRKRKQRNWRPSLRVSGVCGWIVMTLAIFGGVASTAFGADRAALFAAAGLAIAGFVLQIVGVLAAE